MKVAKKNNQVKINKTLDFNSQKAISIIPEINRDNVSSFVKGDSTSEPKEVFVQLNKIRQNHLNFIENLKDNEKEYAYTLINNVLIIEDKMISIMRSRVYLKLYARHLSRDVDLIVNRIDKLAKEVDTLIREMFLSEQIWKSKLWLLNKKEKKQILLMAEDNRNKMNNISFGVTAKWVAYSSVYNKMKRAQQKADLKGKKHITLDGLKEIIEKCDVMKNENDDDNVSVS